jgi:hypothetical protein
MARGFKTGGGSRKGRPNRVSADLRGMVLEALDRLGGVEYLVRAGEANPQVFGSLIGKLLPTRLANDPENPLIDALSAEERAPRRLAEFDAAFAPTTGLHASMPERSTVQ